MQFFLAGEIDWIETADNYVRLHVSGGTHLARDTMAALEQRLDPRQFVRIHRRFVVNVNAILEIRPPRQGNQGSHEVELRDGETLRVGRTHRRRLRQLFER